MNYRISKAIITALVLWGAIFVSQAWAELPDRYNQIRFNAESTEQVQNDRMQAILSVHAEDRNPSSLADRINETMNWALNAAADYENVETKTGTYQTYPVHQKNSLRGWRGSQQLILVAGDFGEIGQLVGRLQERLQVKSMNFSLFPQTRAIVEDQLIYSALEKFKDRAELVKENLNASGYKIVDLTINTGVASPRPLVMMRAQAATVDSVATPALEGGDTRVTVTVSGVIELE